MQKYTKIKDSYIDIPSDEIENILKENLVISVNENEKFLSENNIEISNISICAEAIKKYILKEKKALLESVIDANNFGRYQHASTLLEILKNKE